MKDRIIEAAVQVLKSEPDGMYRGQLMKRILETNPELGGASFGFHLRNWKQEDALAPSPLLATHDETGFFRLASPQPNEIYTDEELAALLNIHPAMLFQWKETQKIPERFLTLDGRYIKSMIDPMIATYRQAAPLRTAETYSEEERLQMAILHEEGMSDQEIALKFCCESSIVDEILKQFNVTTANREENPSNVTSPTTGAAYPRKRLYLTRRDRQRIAMMNDSGLSVQQISVTFGCSARTIRRTLNQINESTSLIQDIQPVPTPAFTLPSTPPPESPHSIAFEELVRDYWSVGTRAVDMLFLPQEVRTKILLAVHDALRYAYKELNADVSASSASDNESPTLLQFSQTEDSLIPSELQDRANRLEPSGRPTNHHRGRPKGSGKYGCQTKAIRVPAHLVADVADYVRTHTPVANGSDDMAYRRKPK